MNNSGFFSKTKQKYDLEKEIITDLLYKEVHQKIYSIRMLGAVYGERFLAGFVPVLDELITLYQNQISKARQIIKFSLSKREKILLTVKIIRVEDKIEIYQQLKSIFSTEHTRLYDKIVMKKHR